MRTGRAEQYESHWRMRQGRGDRWRLAHWPAILVAPFILIGCQPATSDSFTLTVSEAANGALIVSARGNNAGLFEDDMDRVGAQSVNIRRVDILLVDDDEEWRMTYTPGPTPPCISREDHDPFPFVINRPRNCWVLPEQPFRPVPGATYWIESYGHRFGIGSFPVTPSGAIEDLGSYLTN
jgi:hypothetical protein